MTLVHDRKSIAVIAALLVIIGILAVQDRATAGSPSPSLVREVFVASGEGFPDALAGAPLAGVSESPILLVRKDSIPQETVDELVRLNPQTIIILGGTAAVSAMVETDLGAYAFDVIRVSGANRYATAAEISELGFPVVALPTIDAGYFYSCAGTYLVDFPNRTSEGAAAFWTFSSDGTLQGSDSEELEFTFGHAQGTWTAVGDFEVAAIALDFTLDTDELTAPTVARVDIGAIFGAECETVEILFDLTLFLPGDDPLVDSGINLINDEEANGRLLTPTGP